MEKTAPELRQELSEVRKSESFLLTEDDQSNCRIALMLLTTEELRHGHDESARQYHETYLKLGGYTSWEKELEIAGRGEA